MNDGFVLPLFPLDEAVLLPGEAVSILPLSGGQRDTLERASTYGGSIVAALAEGDSVHEIGVTARLIRGDDGATILEGGDRCRLLDLVDIDVPLVRAQGFPESPCTPERERRLAFLLQRRYRRLAARIGSPAPDPGDGLSTLTWEIMAAITLTTDQRQGLLNVPDPVTRGRLLLAFIREVERRERFLRPWSHLRTERSWN